MTKGRARDELIERHLPAALDALAAWEAQWDQFELDETLRLPEEAVESTLAELVARLRDNYPFFHPRYAGQMLKPPHAIARLAYFIAQQINPNNHALDGGPATARMEREAVAELARLFGYEEHLGHLTSSGTIANLEALWVARSLHPERSIAFSREAHYTHRRMCEVIGARALEIEADARGRMDLDDLRAKLRTGAIGTLVVTAGTTGLGAVDPVAEAVALRREFDFRIHVDAAYGGFFRLLADLPGALDEEDAASFRAISECESVVVDPHKHGLQPYGCGSVMFRDPGVGRFYRHDSPYTYFTSGDLHLGEISLECSRAGAAAAALWATLRCFPLRAEEGLGPVLARTRQAALAWASLIEREERLRLVTRPALDIIVFYARAARVSEVERLTERVFARTMNDRLRPVYLAKINLAPESLAAAKDLVWDRAALAALRSVLMKPEHLAMVPELQARVMAALEE